jgi:uncharacterized protein (DUF2267 family)
MTTSIETNAARARLAAAGMSGEDLVWLDRHGWNDADIPPPSTDEIEAYERREGVAMTDIQEFNIAAHAAEEWVNELAQRLGWRNREKVYSALVGTLHALRDSLPAHEAVFLGDHLTVLLRGLYYEGWRLAKYSSLKSRDSFLERVRESVHRDPGIDAEQVACVVLALLAERLPAAELEDVRVVTPKELRALWPI